MTKQSETLIRRLAALCLVGAVVAGCAPKPTRNWVAEPVVINENLDDDSVEVTRRPHHSHANRFLEENSNQPVAADLPQSSGGGEPAQFAGMVAAHNRVRAMVNVPELGWSDALARQAQSWAEHLQSDQGCQMEHSHARGVGENLAWASGQRLNPASVVKMWADESRDFDPGSNSCAPGAVCGHYTQVVWKKTTAVGCGMASCGRDEIWVCNYSPPGNYVGESPF